MRNSTAETLTPLNAPSVRTAEETPTRIRAVELSDWIERRIPFLRERWLREMAARHEGHPQGVDLILEDFIDVLLALLPGLLGPHREAIVELWVRGSELFGAVAARRGLAAGEVIDEVQLLREAVIRLLYQDPPQGGQEPLSLRDVLRLNRAIDMGVTHASVGHTDAMFFALFQGSGIPHPPEGSDLLNEVRGELAAIRRELAEVLGHVPGQGPRAEVREGA